jgi:competence protein ComEA
MERWMKHLAAAGVLAACLAVPSLGLANETVNINAASAAELAAAIPGVGATRAEAIVADRTEHGPFKSVDDLALVSGIGPRILDEARAKLRTE